MRIRTREVTEQKELLAQTNLELQALQNTSTAISGTLDKVDLGRLILEASMSLLNCPGGFLIDYVWATQSRPCHSSTGSGFQAQGFDASCPGNDQLGRDRDSGKSYSALGRNSRTRDAAGPAKDADPVSNRHGSDDLEQSGCGHTCLWVAKTQALPLTNETLSLLTTFANQGGCGDTQRRTLSRHARI